MTDSSAPCCCDAPSCHQRHDPHRFALRSRPTLIREVRRFEPYGSDSTSSNASSAVSREIQSTLPSVAKFNTDRTEIGKKYELALLSFDGRLKTRQICELCNRSFTNALTGTLSCSIHPFRYVNCGTNGSGEQAQDGPVSNCTVCQQLHLLPPLRSIAFDDNPPVGFGVDVDSGGVLCDASVRNTGIPHVLMGGTLSKGCVTIDHCANVYELLNHPYSAVPTLMWHRLVIGKRGELATNVFSKTAVIVVSEPTQLSKTLVVDIPGSSVPYRRSIEAVYDEMAAAFNIQPLADAIYEARITNPQSSISRLTALKHKDADKRDMMRKRTRLGARFCPFVIIARVSQRTNESEGMRLV